MYPKLPDKISGVENMIVNGRTDASMIVTTYSHTHSKGAQLVQCSVIVLNISLISNPETELYSWVSLQAHSD